MIYEHLFRQAQAQQVRMTLLGAGSYGRSLLVQAQRTQRLQVAVVCDRDRDAALGACQAAGLDAERIAQCETAGEAARAVAAGRVALLDDAQEAVATPADVVVEATGTPDAGAVHAELALAAGRHVAMVSKEADCLVGPLLARRAAAAGLVYTPVDGDQHGLLAGLTLWARTLVLRVLSGGKARESDFVLDAERREVRYGRRAAAVRQLDAEALRVLAPIAGQDSSAARIAERREALAGLPFVLPADLCEMSIAANHTGLLPDRPELWAPVVRMSEVAAVLCPQAAGGVLQRDGAIDVFGCLRGPDEIGPQGGEFIVVALEDTATRDFLATKSLPMNRAGNAALLHRPLHLLGVETPITVLTAGLLGVPTGGVDVAPTADLAGRARRSLPAGTVLDYHAIHDGEVLEPLLLPAAAIDTPGAPAPLYLAQGNALTRDVAAGATLAVGDLVEPPEVRVWQLRREQDQLFGAVLGDMGSTATGDAGTAGG